MMQLLHYSMQVNKSCKWAQLQKYFFPGKAPNCSIKGTDVTQPKLMLSWKPLLSPSLSFSKQTTDFPLLCMMTTLPLCYQWLLFVIIKIWHHQKKGWWLLHSACCCLLYSTILICSCKQVVKCWFLPMRSKTVQRIAWRTVTEPWRNALQLPKCNNWARVSGPNHLHILKTDFL